MEYLQYELNELENKDVRLMSLIDLLESTIHELNCERKYHDEVNQHDIDFAVEALTEAKRNVQISRDTVKGEIKALEYHINEAYAV